MMSPVGWETLYLSHALLELVLGLLKLRGRYAHEKPRSKPQRSEMYTRHHGGALLALALQGALVWCYDLVHTPTGAITSASLALFHGAAVCAFMVAWAQRAISAKKVLMPHAPFAILFAWHAYSRFTGPKGALR
mmetsp:Transcript_5314/g.10358  ORF Transcript_5314/g.10358 Transcript_5314/m.10358 type:complete len:134 (-) Transcript_5314:191-592(-)